MKWFALAAARLGLAALAVVLALRAAPAPESGDLAAVLARMDAMQASAEARDAALRRDLERLQRRIGPPAGRSAAVAPSVAQAQARKAEAQQQADARRKRLELAFAGQGAAPRNDPAPAALETAFAHPGVLDAAALPLAEDVQCRARMCLVRARFGPFADGSDWATRVLMEVATSLPDARIVSVPLPGGSTELRIYAARAGVRDPFPAAR